MDRKNYDLMRMLRDNIPCDDCENGSMPNENMPCIDTGFCGTPPKERNDGILTMAFVDMQPLDSVYQNDMAFSSGTLFPNLDKPFYGGMKK